MSDGALVLRGGQVVLSDWPLQAVTTLVERQVMASRANGLRGGPLAQLLEDLREACAGCVAQPAQPATEAAPPSLDRPDEIDVKEAAEMLQCSEQNVRKRAGGSLPAVKIGARWVLSRSIVGEIAGRSR